MALISLLASGKATWFFGGTGEKLNQISTCTSTCSKLAQYSFWWNLRETENHSIFFVTTKPTITPHGAAKCSYLPCKNTFCCYLITGRVHRIFNSFQFNFHFRLGALQSKNKHRRYWRYAWEIKVSCCFVFVRFEVFCVSFQLLHDYEMAKYVKRWQNNLSPNSAKMGSNQHLSFTVKGPKRAFIGL